MTDKADLGGREFRNPTWKVKPCWLLLFHQSSAAVRDASRTGGGNALLLDVLIYIQYRLKSDSCPIEHVKSAQSIFQATWQAHIMCRPSKELDVFVGGLCFDQVG